MCGHTHTCAIHNTVLKNKGEEKKKDKRKGRKQRRKEETENKGGKG